MSVLAGVVKQKLVYGNAVSTRRRVTRGIEESKLTLDKTRHGVSIEQGLDGIWNAQGLRKLAAALKGAAEMLEA